METRKLDHGDWPASVAANFLAGPEHDVIPRQRRTESEIVGIKNGVLKVVNDEHSWPDSVQTRFTLGKDLDVMPDQREFQE